MTRPSSKLRIFEIPGEEARRGRALLIVDALAAKRRVGGDGPWTVAYSTADPSQAFPRCAEDLDAIDPRWVEVIDFVAIRSRPMDRTQAV